MTTSIKITYIISNINKALEFEWAVTELTKKGFKLNFILINSEGSELEKYILKNNIPCVSIKFRNKYFLTYVIYKLIQFLKFYRPDIVHCHLFEATITGLIAAKLSGIKKRVHTRHHSTFHHKYYKHAVKYDKLNNLLSTKIIAISNVVKKILLKEGVLMNKIEVVHHGIDLSEFSNVGNERIIKLKNLYNKENKFPVIGVISRYTQWKGIQYVIPAFKELLKEYPDSLLILANAKGDYKIKIQSILTTLPIGSYNEILFEEDLFALYKLFTIFVHAPIDEDSEAFGQVYIEALAAGIPIVCTKSGIGNDILIHEDNAHIVPYSDPESILQGMKKLLNNKIYRDKIVSNGYETVKEFSHHKKFNRLGDIYLNIIKNG